jgi:probable phosphoglycerate mutase
MYLLHEKPPTFKAGASIMLMRHAETLWNLSPKRFQGRIDIPLSDKGQASAKRLRHTMLIPDRIITSPARRCLQTLDAMYGDSISLVQRDMRLHEIDNGRFSGLLEEEVAKRYPEEWKAWLERPATLKIGGGETLKDMLTRVLKALYDIIISTEVYENVLIITHGGPIRVLNCHFTNRSLNEFHNNRVENLSRFKLMQHKQTHQLSIIEISLKECSSGISSIKS